MNSAESSEEREITAKFNTEELLRGWEERAERAKGVTIVSLLGAKTDLGRIRENNEDKFEFFQPDDPDTLALKGAFYAVADGMGGHAAGQIASELALKTTIKAYYADPSPMVEESLRAAIQQANALVYEAARAIAERAGMGTTMTALVIRGEEAFIAQVGDSRCYRLRDGKLKQMTEDHSWVSEQVKRGGLSEDEAKYSPFRNVITRSLGNAPNVDVDIGSLDLKAEDQFLLCSDGLSGEVEPDEMRKAMQKGSPSQAASELVDLALERGGRDNITVLILAIKEIVKEETKAKKKGFGGLFGR
ncbi:MAG: Stp1/IreP family PP2C-type Ser/Thr phosphatase [Armatimonadetes bacterium]|nr:Stp1/IreP family PP2C-type Ser/Thr phosphatase [Armatimonadota bacterium]